MPLLLLQGWLSLALCCAKIACAETITLLPLGDSITWGCGVRTLTWGLSRLLGFFAFCFGGTGFFLEMHKDDSPYPPLRTTARPARLTSAKTDMAKTLPVALSRSAHRCPIRGRLASPAPMGTEVRIFLPGLLLQASPCFALLSAVHATFRTSARALEQPVLE